MKRTLQSLKSIWWLPILVFLLLSITLLTAYLYDLHRIIISVVASLVFISVIYYCISVVRIIRLKKWAKAAVSIILFTFVLLGFGISSLLILFGKSMEPRFVVLSEEGYIQSFTNETNIEFPEDYRFIAKDDTIYFVGIEDDYTINCVFKVNDFDKKRILNQILGNPNFKQQNKVSNDIDDFFKQRNANLSISDFNESFEYEIDGAKIITVSFHKNKDIIAFRVWAY